MNFIQQIIKEADDRRKQDAERYAKMDDDVCQVCGKKGSDRRSLVINTGYNMHEASELFIELWHVPDTPEAIKAFFYLRMCKGCRARLLGHIKAWVDEGGRLADSHLDDDGISGYTPEEYEKLSDEEKH